MVWPQFIAMLLWASLACYRYPPMGKSRMVSQPFGTVSRLGQRTRDEQLTSDPSSRRMRRVELRTDQLAEAPARQFGTILNVYPMLFSFGRIILRAARESRCESPPSCISTFDPSSTLPMTRR